jgi:tetratricopeptide (TPR) repeat protein
VLFLALLLGASACKSIPGSAMGVPPGPPDLASTDPEVADAIRGAIEASRTARDDPGARARLGMIYEANGFDALAHECYRQALAVDPSQHRWWYRLAIVEVRRGDLPAALMAVERVVGAEEYVPALWQQGQWLFDTGEFGRAEAAFRRAIALDPAGAAGLLGLARVLIETGRIGEASIVLSRVPSPYAEHADLLLAAARRQIGTPGLATVPRVASRYPDPWSDELNDFRYGYGFALERVAAAVRSGRLPEAAARLRAILEKRPDDVAVLNQLGGVYVRLGLSDQAIDILERAVRLQADRFDAHINLATAYFQKHQYERALEYAERTIALNPVAEAFRIQGRILHALRRPHAAMAAFARAMQENPEDLMPHVWTAGVLRGEGRRREALGLLTDVLARDPVLVAAHAEIAMIKMDEGALADARQAVERGSRVGLTDRALDDARRRLERLEGGR